MGDMTDKTLAERLRDAEADEKRLSDELLCAYRAGEFWLTPCASVALDAKDAEIARLTRDVSNLEAYAEFVREKAREILG